MYCVRCKQKTDSMNITHTVTTNNRKMIKSICSDCGSKKSTFTTESGITIHDIWLPDCRKIVKSRKLSKN